jgi:hypothetical protein
VGCAENEKKVKNAESGLRKMKKTSETKSFIDF